MESWSQLKLLKEKSVQGFSGGSLIEIIALTVIPISGYTLWQTFFTSYSNFLIEFMLFIVPTMLACLYPSQAILLSTILFAISLLVNLYPTRQQQPISEKSEWLCGRERGFLVLYRALLIWMTCFCILAVDFPLFPRRFVKVETFGISLMDIGVGSFVFSSGLVYGKKLLHQPIFKFEHFKRSLYNSLFLLILGLLRLFLVKSTNYQEHVSEYGVHWNFFFTLAMLPISIALLRFISPTRNMAFVGLFILTAHELILYSNQDWILNAKRTDLISSNKEGIFSYLGYLSLFCFASQFGAYLFSKTDLVQLKRGLQQILTDVFLLWSLYALLNYFTILEPSRRLANGLYILIVLAFNLSMIAILMIFDFIYPTGLQPPRLLLNASRQTLKLFLIANIFTGLVNHFFNTLSQTEQETWALLTGYMLVLSTITFYLF